MLFARGYLLILKILRINSKISGEMHVSDKDSEVINIYRRHSITFAIFCIEVMPYLVVVIINVP